jgi:ribosomal protein S18 acetylase RimI-like enzyme
MEIRLASPDDLPALVSIQHETQELHVAADPTFFRPATDDELIGAMRDFLATGQTVVWIAWVDDVPAGFLVFKISAAAQTAYCHARNDGLIDQLAVAARFRRRGVGRALMEHAERYAASQGCSELRLGVMVSNAGARQFYAALNFAPTLERWRKRL